MCFGCLKEPSQRDGSFKYPQHMILLRNKKISSSLCVYIQSFDDSNPEMSNFLRPKQMCVSGLKMSLYKTKTI